MWEWVATVVAVVAAGAAFWQAGEARKARVGAQASSDAAADSASRMATAMEEQARIAREAAERYVNPWTFREDYIESGHKWTFVLGGNEPAHEINWQVDPGDEHFNAVGPLPTEMMPGDAVQMTWWRHMGSPNAQKVLISWRHPGETERRETRATLTV